MLPIDKRSEVGFYFAVLSLGVAIYLRIESNRELPLNAEEVA